MTNKENGKKSTITPRNEDFSQWYLDIIEAAQLAESQPDHTLFLV